MAAVKTIAAGELPAWEVGELPEPPAWNFANVMKTIGPGAILLGVSIGSGEWLAGPAVVVRYGLAMLWVTTVSVVLQVLLNMEFVRYTLYSGEPIYTAFMRLKPGSSFWGWFWVTMYFLQVGWPGWAGSAGAGLAQIVLGPAGKVTADIQAWMGIALFLVCIVILAVGSKIERSLELAQWFMIAWIIGFLLVADLFLVPLTEWPSLVAGYLGFSTRTSSFLFIPAGADFFLLGGFAAYSGAGGCINATITNWMRDKGFGMGSVVGYIPSLIGGREIKLSATGKVFDPNNSDNMRKWNIWWKYAGADQYGLWMIGAFVGMGLPALLYTGFIATGTNIASATIAATLGQEMYKVGGSILWLLTQLAGVWILFSTQLGIVDGFVRATTDMIWTGSKGARERVKDVRIIYYGALAVMTIWGIFCLILTVVTPSITGFGLILLGANWAGVNFLFLGVLTLIVNRKFLPKVLQAPIWREIAVVLLVIFFGFFVFMTFFNSTTGLAIMPYAAAYFAFFLVWGVVAYMRGKK